MNFRDMRAPRAHNDERLDTVMEESEVDPLEFIEEEEEKVQVQNFDLVGISEESNEFHQTLKEALIRY